MDRRLIFTKNTFDTLNEDYIKNSNIHKLLNMESLVVQLLFKKNSYSFKKKNCNNLVVIAIFQIEEYLFIFKIVVIDFKINIF